VGKEKFPNGSSAMIVQQVGNKENNQHPCGNCEISSLFRGKVISVLISTARSTRPAMGAVLHSYVPSTDQQSKRIWLQAHYSWEPKRVFCFSYKLMEYSNGQGNMLDYVFQAIHSNVR
jgi:hypothetical protein